MGVETATWITDLQPSNPGSTDLRSQGDDHIRLIKLVLQDCFPNAGKAWYNPTTAAKSVSFSVVAADMNKTFLVDTTGGAVVMTLPTLGAGDAGWECFLLKTTAGVNPVMVTPASGTLTSGAIPGLPAARRSIPGARISCLWSGAGWFISRAAGVGGPVGSAIEFHGNTLPYGFEWPNGQLLASASTFYPEYNAVIVPLFGSALTYDKRGRVGVVLDNLGGAAAGRLGAIINGVALTAPAGTETVTLNSSQVPATAISGTTGGMNSNTTHSHGHNAITGGASGAAAQNAVNGAIVLFAFSNATINSASIDHTHNVSGTVSGGGGAHSNLQPSIIVAQVLVVE